VPTTKSNRGGYTVPGLDEETSTKLVGILQDRLTALTDLHLTLKHVHWNVVGPHFIAVHEMLDPQVEEIREMTDEIAERIATLGGSPVGTMAAMVKARSWDDYSLGRAGTAEHLGALDLVYQGVNADHREAIETTEELDPVSQDMLIAQLGKLELYHWFVRAHLESSSGQLSTDGATTEKAAAKAAAAAEDS
jgi:starvation-inducible DNA-binding protein